MGTKLSFLFIATMIKAFILSWGFGVLGFWGFGATLFVDLELRKFSCSHLNQKPNEIIF